MSRPGPIEYADASPQVRAVFDDIKRTRNVEDVNNFWKYLAARSGGPRAHLGEHQTGDGGGRALPARQGDALCRGERHQRLRLLHCEPHRVRAQGRHDARRCSAS